MSDAPRPALFRDHFSGHAAEYSRFRPTYPEALFSWLASVAPADAPVWDCATGNGQAAVALAAHYPQVWATDASAPQIASAQPHPRVTYRVADASASGLEEHSVGLVTVAQALHWFAFAAVSGGASPHRVWLPVHPLAVAQTEHARI
jgi:hypothetical protein